MTQGEYEEAKEIARNLSNPSNNLSKEKLEAEMARYGAWSDDWDALFYYEKETLISRALK